MRIEVTPHPKLKGKKIYTIELELDSYGIYLKEKIIKLLPKDNKREYFIKNNVIQLSPEGIEKEYYKKNVKARSVFINELFGEINIGQKNLLERVLNDYYDLLDTISEGECETTVDEVTNEVKHYCNMILNHITYLKDKKEKLETTESEPILWRGSEASLIELYIQLANRGWIKSDIKPSENRRSRKYTNIDWMLIANHFALIRNSKLDPVKLAKRYDPKSIIVKNNSNDKNPIQKIEWLKDISILIDLFVQLCIIEHEFIESRMLFVEKNYSEEYLKDKKKVYYSRDTDWSFLVNHFVVHDKSKLIKKLKTSDLAKNFKRMKDNTAGRSKASFAVSEVLEALGKPPSIRPEKKENDYQFKIDKGIIKKISDEPK